MLRRKESWAQREAMNWEPQFDFMVCRNPKREIRADRGPVVAEKEETGTGSAHRVLQSIIVKMCVQS
jgi:hypothetical protein